MLESFFTFTLHVLKHLSENVLPNNEIHVINSYLRLNTDKHNFGKRFYGLSCLCQDDIIRFKMVAAQVS